MNPQKFLKPYIIIVIFIGTVLGIILWNSDTRPMQWQGSIFIIISVIFVFWQVNIGGEIGLTFSTPIFILLMCMFSLRTTIIAITIFTIFNEVMRFYRYHYPNFEPSVIYFLSIVFNFCVLIISQFVSWQIYKLLKVDLVHTTDIWKLALVVISCFLVELALVHIVVYFHTAVFKFYSKETYLYLVCSILLNIMLIYLYHDRGFVGVVLVFLNFIPVQNFTKMYLKLKAQEDELFLDPLTEISNFKYFKDVINNKIEKRMPFILFYMDLNEFKAINDKHGHEVGNIVLQHFAEQLKKMYKNNHKVFRIGGDEFCIIANTDLKYKNMVTKNLEDTSNKLVSIKGDGEGEKVKYSVSYGIAYYDGTMYVDWKEIVDKADKEMYIYKNKNVNK